MDNNNYYGNSNGGTGNNYGGNTQNPASGQAQKEDYQKYFNILNNLNRQHDGTGPSNAPDQSNVPSSAAAPSYEMPSVQIQSSDISNASAGQPSYTEYMSSVGTGAGTSAQQPAYNQYVSSAQQNYNSSSAGQYSSYGSQQNYGSSSANQYSSYGSHQSYGSSSADQRSSYGSQQNYGSSSADQYSSYGSQQNYSGYSSYGSSNSGTGSSYANDRSNSSYQNQSYQSGNYNQPLSSGNSYYDNSYSSGYSGYSTGSPLSGYLLGLLGAFIGAIPGVLLITFLGNLGYAACISGIVLFYCVFFLYRKLSGAGDSFSKADWCIVIGVCIISVYIAVKCSYVLSVKSEAEKLGASWSFGDIYSNFSELLEIADAKGNFIFSLFITYFCTFIGAIRSFKLFSRR